MNLRVPVQKNGNGETIAGTQTVMASGSPMQHMLVTCRDHKLRWGPLCRAMGRKPAGRENVSIECKSCSRYIEYDKPQ